jgi:hypothetical protein
LKAREPQTEKLHRKHVFINHRGEKNKRKTLMERLQICVRNLSFGQAACGVPLIQAVPIRKTNPLDVVFSTFEKSIILTKRQKGL